MIVRSTSQTWDSVRTAFASSIMVDTPLSSLAQSLDGPDWPLVGADEVPATYIDLSFDEAVARLTDLGQPAERIDDLITILRDTLAFDEPFGEMVEQGEAASARDNPIRKNLAKLEIPESFPIALSSLSTDTLAFCEWEQLHTLGEFAVFAQSMSRQVIVGGDFRALLNALSHVDEGAIARFLPFRPGAKGLHLVEAVAQVALALAPPARAAVVANVEAAPAAVLGRVAQVAAYFEEEREQIRAQLATGSSLSRFVRGFDDELIERTTIALLAPQVVPAPAPEASVRGNWFTRLFRR